MRYGLLFALFLGLASPARGQTVGTCNLGNATADLDVANVRARMYNRGGIFWIGGSPLYEVPKDSGKGSIFATNPWIGGFVDGNLRMSAATYRDWEFWPGPLDENGNPPTDCSVYDRIYSVYDEDIRRYNESGEATDDMRDWPWQLGAPVFDGDGDPDNYDLAAGDRPYVYGDQTAWWVMNDVGNQHLYSDAPPLGLEARVSAFAAESSEDSWLRNATFYRYELVYRGSAPVDSLYFGIWSDPDLGDSGDDMVGSDSLLGLGYVYNGDDLDDGMSGYGSRPPALAYQITQGPLIEDDGLDNDRDGSVDEPGERLRTTSFLTYNGDQTAQGNPSGASDMYGYLIPRWKDGRPVTFGGGGSSAFSGPVQFMYSGNPPDFWSEENIDGQGTRHTPGDRLMIVGTGPFRMEPGDTQEIVVSILWARGGDRFDSIRLLKEAAQNTEAALPLLMAFDTTVAPTSPPPEVPPGRPDYRLFHYPEPVSEIAIIDFELPTSMTTRLVLYDALGRDVTVIADSPFSEGTNRVSLSVADLPAGSYFVRLETGVTNLIRTITVVR